MKTKPVNIPAAAIWNPEWNEWMLGEQNEEGTKTGIWQEWHVDGHLCGTIDYKNGQAPFLNKRFHPDGTLAQEGNWLGGRQWEGTYRWIKSENTTPEYFPGGYTNDTANVWVIEYDYTAQGTAYNARRYFDRQNNPVTIKGTPLPERPATVPLNACFIEADPVRHILPHWVMSEIDPWQHLYFGDYAEWDTTGTLLLKRVFDRDAGILLEEYIADIVPEQVKNYYYSDTHPPVCSHSLHYSYNGKDEKEVFFDDSGELLYTIRRQQVTYLHTRRYYNDILIYEGIHNIDNTKPPASIRYFYPGGAILIDYLSDADGTGTWRMYDEAGQELMRMHMQQEEISTISQNNRWTYFIPDDPLYTTSNAYYDAIIRQFSNEHNDYVINKKIKALPVPAYLQAALDNIDWGNIETAWENGNELPPDINGLLSADEAIAARCRERLWWRIECRGALYEATYITTVIVAQMLPFYKNTAVAERLFDFLYKVMIQPNLHTTGYDEMITSLQFLLPNLLQRAADNDPLTARQAQQILIRVGKESPETAALLQQEWQRTIHPPARRNHALFCLGKLYALADNKEKINAYFAPLFQQATDPLPCLILAMFLTYATEYTTHDELDPEINNTLKTADLIIADLDPDFSEQLQQVMGVL